MHFHFGLFHRCSDAYAFLQQRSWETSEIVELLDRLNTGAVLQGSCLSKLCAKVFLTLICSPDDEGSVDKEALVRAHDAMLNKDGQRRNVSSALAITSQERLYVIQVLSRRAAHCVLPLGAHLPLNPAGAKCISPAEGRPFSRKLA